MRRVLIASTVALACAETAAPPAEDVVSLVDPLIGSGGAGYAQGQAFPGATVPFGMVKPGPDTAGPLLDDFGFAHCSGYWHKDDSVLAFSQLHLHGTGIEDHGQVRIMAALGIEAAKTSPGKYRQRFSHATEVASPGYYAVTLEDTLIRAELTASTHAAFHRYTFPAGAAEPTILIDAGRLIGQGKIPDGEIAIDSASWTIEGWLLSAGRFTGEGRAFKVYFAIALGSGSGPAIARSGVFQGSMLREGETRAAGEKIGAFVTLPAGTAQAELRAGISFIDLEGARRHRDTIAAKSFDEVRSAAEDAWRRVLSTVQIDGGSPADRRTFYSALYRSFLLPTQLSESDGRYMGIDRQVHTAEGFTYYTDLSLWDTYRTLHPLLAMLAPEVQGDVVASLLAMGDQHGAVPRWPLAVNETGTMLGSPASIVFADSAARGVTIDAGRALDAAIADADGVSGKTIRGNIQHCLTAGYCPADKVGGSVANTLEYAWADFAIAELAGRAGRHGEEARFRRRTRMWIGHWDPASRFLRGKNSDGTWWSETIDPVAFTDEFVEGNAWQYLWEVPFDVPELARQFGGKEALLGKLDTFFDLSQKNPAPTVIQEGNFKGPDDYYWHGNEPDIHAPYLYALAGEPDRGARWIDWVRRTKYDDTPDGLAGNDDAGTLSAWYVFSALGFYPLAGSDVYVIGTPLFDRATLHLAGGDLVIIREGEGLFIRSATFGGRTLSSPILRHGDLARGGELRFVMSTELAGWGRGEAFGQEDPGR